ncbi:MAG: prolyl oligopeptidase family serine peptidase [Dokdonella sp.]
MSRLATVVCCALLCIVSAFAASLVSAVTLEQAMANPDWIGPPVERPYWTLDGRGIYYSLKQDGKSIRDLYRIGTDGSNAAIIDPKAMANADGANPVFDASRRYAAFIRNDDVFLRELSNGRLIQVTRTPKPEASPQFSADGRSLQYRQENDWFIHDIASGVSGPAALLKLENDPDAKKPDDLAQLQQRLFSTLREIKADKDAKKAHEEAFASGDPTRAPLPVYVGDDIEITDSSLSPDGKHLLLVTTPKSYDAGKVVKLQKWVTESGYEESEDERTRVGRGNPAPQSLLSINLATRKTTPVKMTGLAGIGDDPLKAIRDENATEIAAIKAAAKADTENSGTEGAKDKDKKAGDKSTERAVTIAQMKWSSDGRNVAVQLRSIDNKDRWIASVDFSNNQFIEQQRLTDPAWINWNFNDFGWTRDGRAIWYLSEETGYSQLYVKTLGGKAKALTSGTFEVSGPVESADGRWFYVRSNKLAPYSYDVYRVAANGGDLQRVTPYQGLDSFVLSPDDRQLAVLHSSSHIPQQLAVLSADGSGVPTELTDTRKPAFKALQWQAPTIVSVPSSQAALPIWAKLYRPADFDANKRYPAVLFVHGAGYLQNTHLSYPNYFREQMFHNLLTERGFVVLDMDYRASEGYGRDWRTAIYRQMGTPELQDLVDGVDWLAKNHAVDRENVGVYGGSYGGFMSLMALFRQPDVFKAGAALRPVTDWTSYNHEYTSNILNNPQDDPIAYRRSSPIEYADGLKGHLLIAHGMIDDNVLFQDSIRLYQRLIELRKEDFEIAPYPMERHGFVHSDSWYDEYRRILKLFDDNLK